jgi:predicted 3-demethylubiquinone-9 3-methyltransferase (glyoxalase superfamily)
MSRKNSICLWYNGNALEAAQFYAKTFPDSSVGAVHRAPGDYPSGKEGNELMVEFTVMGIPCLGLNGGPEFKHNESFSFAVLTEDQAETDRYWNAIVGNGGAESACGWCKDKWGVSWQITPRVLMEGVTSKDHALAKRVFEAMMPMTKIDVAKIEAARQGQPPLDRTKTKGSCFQEPFFIQASLSALSGRRGPSRRGSRVPSCSSHAPTRHARRAGHVPTPATSCRAHASSRG